MAWYIIEKNVEIATALLVIPAAQPNHNIQTDTLPDTRIFSLNDWLAHLPPGAGREHLGLSAETPAGIPDANLAVLPAA
jgi:hypothetical protein